MEKKLGLINLPLHLRESLDKRARGESKTFDTMIPNLYLASLGFKGIWFGSGKQQIEQPKKYMKFIIENSYLKFLISDLLKEKVIFQNEGELKLLNLTELNARSPRADFVTYDEEAQAEKDAYNAAVNILAGSDLGLVFHISTPTKASVFEENHDRLKIREITTGEQFIFSRTWEDASWLARKKDWYDEQRKILPAWYFRQEHEASFEVALGEVFQNVEYGPYPEWLLEHIKDQYVLSGLDWNPVAGHIIVGIKWTPDMTNCVIMEEADIGQGYAVEMTDNMWNVIKTKASHGRHLNYECSGINEEYVKWLNKKKSTFEWQGQNWHSEEWDSAVINKLRIATFIIQNAICIWVDKVRFPNTAKDIGDFQWDPEADKPRLKKDKAASPHFGDAFLHAASEENRRDTTITFGDWY